MLRPWVPPGLCDMGGGPLTLVDGFAKKCALKQHAFLDVRQHDHHHRRCGTAFGLWLPSADQGKGSRLGRPAGGGAVFIKDFPKGHTGVRVIRNGRRDRN